jgi:Holliday junction DNA helicase RuvA
VIGSLRGVLLERAARSSTSAEVLLEVGGVGYRLSVTSRALKALGPPGSTAFFHVHTHVREDAIVLYGFLTRDEMATFEALMSARGVGPGVALALLSVHTPADLQRAVLAGDADALALVPGIGKKTAARLLVELEARIATISCREGAGVAGVDGGGAAVTPAAELRAALASLGYGPDEVRHAMSKVAGEASLEDQLRQALRELAAVR